jgi:hypothetical protein
MTGPRRRVSDHVHPEYWEEAQQHRYEDRLAEELQRIRKELARLGTTITLMMGALALLVFAIPVIAPFIRSALNLP